MKSVIIQAQIEPEQKRKAERILREMGFKPSEALGLFYEHIALEESMPFLVTCKHCKKYSDHNRKTKKILRDSKKGKDLIRYPAEKEALKALGL